MTNKKNVRVTDAYLQERNAVAKALTDVYTSFVDKEDYKMADVARFATTNFLGGSRGIKLIDPDSLFLISYD